MKRFLFIFQILFLTIFISGGSRNTEATNVNLLELPSRAQDRAYYKQLDKSGNFYTKDHEWLRNGSDHIQVGISYFTVAAIGNNITIITPMLAVDETFSTGTLLAEIAGSNGTAKLHAPCAGIVKGINPLIATPEKMTPKQVWVYKCELRKSELDPLMDEAAYTAYIR